MRWWHAGVLVLVVMLGCEHTPAPPPVPPPAEDLSTWTVPEIVTAPPEAPPVTPIPVEDKPTAAERVYPFTPGTTFQITVASGVPLDLVLERGEEVRNLVGGDREIAGANQTPRWEVKEGADGQGDSLRHHVFLTASAPGLTMGMIMTTTKRTYYTTCKSVKTSPIRVVRWHYAPETVTPLTPREPGLLPDPAQPMRYHVGYEMASSQPQAPHWLPRQILDDGKKVYIVYPEVTLFDTVPLLRLIGPNGPQLVHARQFLNVVIVDQLVGRAELRVGLGEQPETVTITRGTLRTIHCPGDEACPVWPQAAQALAKKHP